MQEEKRASKRTRYFVEVELDGFLKATLSDLSPDGAFIDSRMSLSPGTVVQLRFAVLGCEVETAAEVRHCSPGIGVGVRFVGLDPGVRMEIERLLASGSAAADTSGS